MQFWSLSVEVFFHQGQKCVTVWGWWSLMKLPLEYCMFFRPPMVQKDNFKQDRVQAGFAKFKKKLSLPVSSQEAGAQTGLCCTCPGSEETGTGGRAVQPSWPGTSAVPAAVNLSTPRPALCRARLCCRCGVAFRHPSASALTLPADCTEEPAGSSHSVPAIVPPAWPCSYPAEQQEVLLWAACLSDSRNDK